MTKPICLFCHDNYGEDVPAVFLAPQRTATSGPFDFVPVCDNHADGWWDGSDYPDGAGAPPLQKIAS